MNPNNINKLTPNPDFLKDLEKIKPKVSPIVLYDKSFVFDDNFEDKRFFRYVDKVKQFIFNELKTSYGKKMTEEDKNSKIPAINLTEFIIDFFAGYYMLEDDFIHNKKTIYSNIHNYYIENNSDTDELLELKDNFFSQKKISLLEDMIEYETKSACKQFIRLKSAELGNIDKSNYFLTQPKTTIEALTIFKMIIDWVYIDLERFFIDNNKVSSNDCKDINLNEYKSKIEELEKQIEEERKNSSDKSFKIKYLEEKIEKRENKENSDLQRVIENNFELQRKFDKLTRKYNSLAEKYNTLKEQFDEENIEIVEKEVSLIELNPYGKYLFVLSEESSFMDVIVDAFPNVEFCFENKNISKKGYDMVVCITSHIDHSTYLGIKAQCKTNNIPFVHCKHSNIPLIRQLMSERLNS